MPAPKTRPPAARQRASPPVFTRWRAGGPPDVGSGGLAVDASSSTPDGAVESVGEFESVDGVAGDVEQPTVEQVVASDAQPDQQIKIGGSTK